MLGFELSFIPGMMLGIEFPDDPEGVLLVLDLCILRIVIWVFDESDMPPTNL